MFFQGCQTVNEVKSEYRRLCFIHHPDVGGDTATMQQLNAAYHNCLKTFHGQVSHGSDGKEHTYYYNQEVEQAIMDKINELLALRLPDLDILLVGTWVWVTGNTRPVKEQLKQADLMWHSKRLMWYWHAPTYNRKYSGVAFEDLCHVYGVKSYKASQEEREALAA